MLLNRKENIDQKMSNAFQIKIEKKITDKLRSLKRETSNKNKLNATRKTFGNYLCFLQNIMKKKTLIGLAIGATLIVAAVWLNLKPQTAQTPELNSLLTYTDQSLSDVETAIKDLDDIDETSDNEESLAMTIENLIQEIETAPTPPLSDTNQSDAKTTPPDNAVPAPKIININTSDLDGLLNDVDTAYSAANNSISDLDSIDENEDKVNI